MLIGKKIGMTRLFDESGIDYPVTMVEAGPCVVTQLKTIKRDGYESMQVGFMDLAKNKITKPVAGHFKNAKTAGKRYLKEFSILNNDISCGSKINVDAVEVGELVDVMGVSKGRGFAGVMKRHGFSGGRRSHGKNSVMRKPGAIGASADPARVWPGKAKAGRMGGNNVTIKKLNILNLNIVKKLVLIR